MRRVLLLLSILFTLSTQAQDYYNAFRVNLVSAGLSTISISYEKLYEDNNNAFQAGVFGTYLHAKNISIEGYGTTIESKRYFDDSKTYYLGVYGGLRWFEVDEIEYESYFGYQNGRQVNLLLGLTYGGVKRLSERLFLDFFVGVGPSLQHLTSIERETKANVTSYNIRPRVGVCLGFYK